jgi:O-antigen/teichoic acid export membrane protein
LTVSVASLIGRFGVLAAIVAVGHTFTGSSRDSLVFLIGATTAAQVLLDPNGVCAFVVTRWSTAEAGLDAGPSALVRTGFLMVSCTALVVFATPVLFAVGKGFDSELTLAAVGIGALAAAEGLARFGRVRFQATQRFNRFAAVDLMLATGRLLVAIVVVAAASITAFAIANCVVAAIVLTVTLWLFLPRRSTDAKVKLTDFVRGVWPFSGGTMTAAVYSQGPLIILGVVGSIHSAAVYTVSTRVTQPLELVPASVSAVYLPRLMDPAEDRPAIERKQLKIGVVLGGAAALLILALSPVLPYVFGYQHTDASTVMAILAFALPFKFVNYQLVSIAFAHGKERQRLQAALVVAVMSVVLVTLAAGSGPTAVAGVTVLTEATLTAMLMIAARGPRFRRSAAAG